ncbi:hypothetical protein MCOR25_004379 [Pyricularia grisea]|uniref:18S rRNA factor 2 n=1 Tax=Pyricularia grisea TaxID=148305 RepID=A0A6P8BJX1_PYRGI|nr:uncharacterized protein PgNI_02197 [Pyricularia grisea]KAI6369750.1 hypothetical protein MCOR25_004379 [Pyricularia grisea]TLD16970.1 hypothetical protein PgNI_02197 [Pyricularia grisea]
MAPEKRNHFLDADESDDEQSQGYNSEAEELTKGGRSAKRRKIGSDSDIEDDDDFSDQEEEDHSVLSPTQQLQDEDGASAHGATKQRDGDEGDEEDGATSRPKKSKDVGPKLRTDAANPLKKNLVVTDKQIKKSGVVYLSRIPPFMKPSKLRSLLVPYGKINRIFLSPEDPEARKRRLKAGGNKKRCFVDGWVEFLDKKDAKAVAEVLNGQTIGGKKGSYYRDDIWTLLYLKGFKWHNLMEQIAAENLERANRMRAEIARSTKENKEFVRQAERAKVLEGIQSKKKAKGQDEQVDKAHIDGGAVKSRSMKFEQVHVASKKETTEPPAQAQKTLRTLF